METLVEWFLEGPIIVQQFGLFYASATTTAVVRYKFVSNMLNRIEFLNPAAFHSLGIWTT
jgi:hypothetical protein